MGKYFIKKHILLILTCFSLVAIIGCASTDSNFNEKSGSEHREEVSVEENAEDGDISGNISEAYSGNALSETVPTNIPIILPQGTDGTLGSNGRYVLFGDWPQSVKAEGVTVNESEIKEINGWTCYKGSDNGYYVKEKANPYIDKYNQTQLFSNDTEIEKDAYYYFKMEPIKWRVLDDCFQDSVLLLAENALISGDFYSSGVSYEDSMTDYNEDEFYGEDSFYNNENDFFDESDNSSSQKDVYDDSDLFSNNYEYSTIRAYLNGLDGSPYEVQDFSGKGFINMAFSQDVQEYIIPVDIDNSLKSATDSTGFVTANKEFICENTKDKVFLLSENEITREDFGFDRYDKEDFARIRRTTDYSRATGCYSDTWAGLETNSLWWLRSPVQDYFENARIVEINGSAFSDYYVGSKSVGIVPAVTVSIELF